MNLLYSLFDSPQRRSFEAPSRKSSKTGSCYELVPSTNSGGVTPIVYSGGQLGGGQLDRQVPGYTGVSEMPVACARCLAPLPQCLSCFLGSLRSIHSVTCLKCQAEKWFTQPPIGSEIDHLQKQRKMSSMGEKGWHRRVMLLCHCVTRPR